MTNWKLAVNWWTQQSLGFDFCLKRDALTGTSISDVAERRKVTTSRRSRVISLKIWHRFHDIYIYTCTRYAFVIRRRTGERTKKKIANVFMKLAMLYLSYELLCLGSPWFDSLCFAQCLAKASKMFFFPISQDRSNKFNHFNQLCFKTRNVLSQVDR